MNDHKTTKVGKITVTKRALRIEELEDKVRFAVDSYRRAFEKYEKGIDAIADWDMVIRALDAQMQEMRGYLAVAYHNAGVIYASKGEYEKSLEYLNKALQFNPKYPIAHHNIAIVYKKTGEIEKADRHFRHARKLGYEPKA